MTLSPFGRHIVASPIMVSVLAEQGGSGNGTAFLVIGIILVAFGLFALFVGGGEGIVAAGGVFFIMIGIICVASGIKAL